MDKIEKILGQTTFATLPNVIFNETLKLDIDIWDTLIPLLFNIFSSDISPFMISLKAAVYLAIKIMMEDEKAVYKAMINFIGVLSGDELTPFLTKFKDT